MSLNIYTSIEEGLNAIFGNEVSIVSKSYVGGGDINDSSLLKLSNGEVVFAKENSFRNRDFFCAEESGIEALASTKAITVPELLFRGADETNNSSFLCMRYIRQGSHTEDFWEDFGHKLARMHLAETKKFTGSGNFGFNSDNYIGATSQINTPESSWLDFFLKCRLEPQFKMADDYFDSEMRHNIERFLDKIPSLIVEPNVPSLLHGDLWSGNYMVGNDGHAVLIDPAVYVGHAEADLAMTELFGRFPQRFYDAYSEVNKIEAEYIERRDIYNLYHLLNHLNLFGIIYLDGVLGIVNSRSFS